MDRKKRNRQFFVSGIPRDGRVVIKKRVEANSEREAEIKSGLSLPICLGRVERKD